MSGGREEDPAFPEVPIEEATLELVRRLKSGEEEAWVELYRRYHDDLLFAVRVHLGPGLRGALESEDILQSVVLDAFRALPSYEHRHSGGLRAYLHSRVVNKIRDRARRMGTLKRDGAVPLSHEIEAELASTEGPTYFAGERLEQLERCLAALPPEMARVIVLRKVDGLSSQDVAARIGKSDAATRKLYSRALARLSLLMGARED